MPPSDAVLWLGPPAPWAAALGPAVHVAEGPDEVRGTSPVEAALVVIGAAEVEGLGAWLQRPRARPPVLVLTDDDGGEAELAALAAGAEEALPHDAGAEAAAQALRRAHVRHRSGEPDESLFRVLVESATDLLGVLDAAGRCVYVNPAVADVLGYAPEAVIGTRAFDLVHPDDADTVAAFYARRLQGVEGVRPVRFRAVAAGGAVRVLEGISRAVRGRDGRLYGVVCVRDVTDDEEAVLRLRASEARSRTLVAGLPDVVVRLRDDGTVLDVHVPEAFETEFPVTDIVGHRVHDLFPDDLVALFEQALSEVRTTGGPAARAYTVDVGGRGVHREARLVPLGPTEVLALIRDAHTDSDRS